MSSPRLRVFRPLLGWIVASSLLFLWQYHRSQAKKATMQFTVSTEGLTKPIPHEATVDGLPYKSGQPCGVGWKKLVVQAENAEPFETNCIVWYAGKSFGDITLARTRGRMELDFSPAVESVQIIGEEEKKSLDNITRESLSLATGRYAVETRFARFSTERTVEVTRNQTSRVAIAMSLATLNLSSEPEKAEFELASKSPPNVSVRGSTPAALTDLPIGEYELAIARGDYRKRLPVRLTGPNSTNELTVQFRYARLAISSEPAGATVNDGGRVLGRTPAQFDLQPGSYHFQILKPGYFGTNFDLTLSETDSRMLSVNLANVSFVEAIERARRGLSGAFPDYDRALSDVQAALQIKPDDENALQLKRTIELNRHLRNATQLQRTRDFTKALAEVDAALALSANHTQALTLKGELENTQRAADEQRAKAQQAAAAAQAQARRKHPEKVLQDNAGRLRYHELFESQLIRGTGSLDAARASLLRALGRKPEWKVEREEKADNDTVLITAVRKGFGWKQNVVLVAGEVGENEVVVCFKLFAFVLGDNVELTLRGLTDESYKPLHPKYAPPTRASAVERNLDRDTQEFKKRLEEELR